MVDRTTKTVKVSTEAAEQWDDYVSSNAHVDSVSHLIRLAVSKEMAGDGDGKSRSASETASEHSGEILTTLQDVETVLGDLEERVASVEEIDKHESKFSLKKAVWEVLPDEPPEVVDVGEGEYEIPPAENLDNLPVLTAREIAQRLGADVDDVEEVLDGLVEETGQVQCSDRNHAGEHYWRKA